MLIALTLVLMILAALLTVESKDLLYGAICLGFLSVFTSILFYAVGSLYASIFELSIGAGLITILFMATITLVEQPRKKSHVFETKTIKGLAFALISLIVLWIGNSLVKGGTPITGSPAIIQSVPDVLWKHRLLDVFSLGIVVFTAAIGMGVLFRTEGKG